MLSYNREKRKQAREKKKKRRVNNLEGIDTDIEICWQARERVGCTHKRDLVLQARWERKRRVNN